MSNVSKYVNLKERKWGLMFFQHTPPYTDTDKRVPSTNDRDVWWVLQLA